MNVVVMSLQAEHQTATIQIEVTCNGCRQLVGSGIRMRGSGSASKLITQLHEIHVISKHQQIDVLFQC